jgi:hypothetical protein
MSALAPAEISVRFSTKAARVLECDVLGGRIDFTLDSGSRGDRSICLEHHPATRTRDATYIAAFEAARQYLVSCGYEVEIDGE